MNLYTTHAKEFSNSRQSPWKGWQHLISGVQLPVFKEKLEVLDLGCGNGRFLKFLQDSNLNVTQYLGLDNSDGLLKIAEQTLTSDSTNIKFSNVDLNNTEWSKDIDHNYNLIAAFGLMHHIESFEARKKILENSASLLEKDDFLVITYWQFGVLNRYKDKIMRVESNNSRYSENDYSMPFGKNGATRFTHYCNNAEIAELEKFPGLKVIGSFISDGRENNENLYKIYGKQD